MNEDTRKMKERHDIKELQVRNENDVSEMRKEWIKRHENGWMKREVEQLLSSSLSRSFLSEGLLTGGEGRGGDSLSLSSSLFCPLLYRVLNCIWPQNMENLREGRGEDELSGVIRRKEDEEEGG